MDEEEDPSRKHRKVVAGVEYTISSELFMHPMSENHMNKNSLTKKKDHKGGGGGLKKVVKNVITGVGILLLTPLVPFAYVLMMNNTIKNKATSWFLPMTMSHLTKITSNIKKELLKDVKGKVLDLGAGSGGSLQFFVNHDKITEYVALEPNPELEPLIHQTAKNLRIGEKFKFRTFVGYTSDLLNIESELGTYDYVILANVLCEVPDQVEVLKEISALLKSQGKFIFQEHVLSDDQLITSLLQRSINPFWSVLSGGCNCNRATLEVIQREKGWNIVYWKLNVPFVFRFISPHVFGIASKL